MKSGIFLMTAFIGQGLLASQVSNQLKSLELDPQTGTAVTCATVEVYMANERFSAPKTTASIKIYDDANNSLSAALSSRPSNSVVCLKGDYTEDVGFQTQI